jgi:hypothetical protein
LSTAHLTSTLIPTKTKAEIDTTSSCKESAQFTSSTPSNARIASLSTALTTNGSLPDVGRTRKQGITRTIYSESNLQPLNSFHDLIHLHGSVKTINRHLCKGARPELMFRHDGKRYQRRPEFLFQDRAPTKLSPGPPNDLRLADFSPVQLRVKIAQSTTQAHLPHDCEPASSDSEWLW